MGIIIVYRGMTLSAILRVRVYGAAYRFFPDQSLESVLLLPKSAQISLLLYRVRIDHKVHSNTETRVTTSIYLRADSLSDEKNL